MQVHDLQPNNKKNRKKKRIGRGGKWETYGGQGDKGQKSRAGGSTPSYEERLIKKFPKLRGIGNPPKSQDARAVNVGQLEDYFEDGDVVSKDSLVSKGLVDEDEPVKILGDGEISKSLEIEVDISAGAADKIKEAGGVRKDE